MNKLKYILIPALMFLPLAHISNQGAEATVTQFTPDGKEKKVKYASDRIVVKFKDNLQYCAECLAGSNKTFQQAMKSGTTKLDKLMKKYEVSSIDPVFRKSRKPKDGKIRSSHSVAKLKAEQKDKIVKTSKKFNRQVSPDDVPGLYHVYTLKLKKGMDVMAVIRDFQSDMDAVEYAEPDYIGEFCVTPNDPEYIDQWGYQAIAAEQAWDKFANTSDIGKGVIAAVLDSGIYPYEDLNDNYWFNPGEFPGVDDNGDGEVSYQEILNHGLVDQDPNDQSGLNPFDLFGSVFEDGIDNDGNGFVDDFFGWDFTSCQRYDGEKDECEILKERNNNPGDDLSHGTHIAGTIAAITNNDFGFAGTSWNTKLMAVKIGFSAGLSESDAAEAMIYAVDNGADVINMSWFLHSVDYRVRLFEETIKYAVTSGTVLVAAAGNDGMEFWNFPSTSPDVIAVGATNDQELNADFSTYGSMVEIAAPGEDVLSVSGYKSGTSMATPHVVGVAALMMSYYDNLGTGLTRVEKVRRIIRATAFPHNNLLDVPFGDGRLNAAGALSVNPDDILLARIEPVTETVRGNIEVRGIASGSAADFDHYDINSLNYDIFDGDVIREKIGPSYFTPVHGGVLAEVDTHYLPEGYTSLELVVYDKSGRSVSHEHYFYIDNYAIWGHIESVNNTFAIDGVTVNLLKNEQVVASAVTEPQGYFNFLSPLEEGYYDIVPSKPGYRFDPEKIENYKYDPWVVYNPGVPIPSFDIIALHPPVLAPIQENMLIFLRQIKVLYISASDPEGQPVMLSAALENGSALSTIGATFTDYGNGTGRFLWRPYRADQLSEHQIMFTATDTEGLSDSQTVTITVEQDTAAPTVPGNLRATPQLNGRVLLEWDASSDNSGQMTYNILRNGSSAAGTISTSFTDGIYYALSPGTTYTYKVYARDSSGNMSGYSNEVSVTMPGQNFKYNDWVRVTSGYNLDLYSQPGETGTFYREIPAGSEGSIRNSTASLVGGERWRYVQFPYYSGGNTGWVREDRLELSPNPTPSPYPSPSPSPSGSN